MTAGSSGAEEGFYQALVDLDDFRQVAEPSNYSVLPESWWIGITDVRGSTRAIEAGRYRDVNAVGVASIIGVQNAMPGLEIPYCFGGDGATFAIPGSQHEQAEKAFRGVRWLAREAFDLELRCGLIPLRLLYQEGHLAKVAPLRSSPHIRLAMFAGAAFSRAESLLKDPVQGTMFEVTDEGERLTDFGGFECRWRPIPASRGAMVSLLTLALSPDEIIRAETYTKVIERLEEMISIEAARPIKRETARFKGIFDDFTIEARVRGAGRTGPSVQAALRDAKQKTIIARALGLARQSAGGYDPAKYKSQLVENTDFRKFDETLRMVVDLTEGEFEQVRSFLEEERRGGSLAYGTHQSPAALMTCLVRSYDGDHLHFVDGSDGGYALAAKELKSQLRRPHEMTASSSAVDG